MNGSQRCLRRPGSLPLLIAAALLSACSGGGGYSSSSTPEPPPVLGFGPDLSALSMSLGAFDQTFQPDRTAYTANVGYLDSSVQFAVQSPDPAASIRVNGMVVSAGETAPIDLAEGRNAIEITVEKGGVSKSYSVDVTRESHTSFSQTAYVKASHPDIDDVFGIALSLSEDTLVVGALREDSAARGVDGDASDDSAMDSGAAHVFVRDSGGTWSQQAYLKASNTDAGDAFGYTVAVSGNIVAIGAPGESSGAVTIAGDEDDNSAPGAGAVYIFVRDPNGHWSQEAYIKPSDTVARGGFGAAVALDGNTLVVTGYNMPQQLVGTLYVFSRDENGSWSQQAMLRASDGGVDSAFGQVLALHEDTLAVGAPFHGGIFDSSGAVYVFTRNAGAWSEKAILRGSNTEPHDTFGTSVALSGDRLAVGAPGEASAAVGIGGDLADNSASSAGAVYVFERNDAGDWNQKAYVKAANTDAGDLFGSAVALSGDWLAVAAQNEGSNAIGIGGDDADNSRPGSGAGYLFVRNQAGEWSQELYVKAANAGANDRFGRITGVLSRRNLVFGASFEDGGAAGVNGDGSDDSLQDSGAVYIFE